MHLVIHMDPISKNCEKTNEIKYMVENICKEINDELKIHDFRITDGENKINLIFDLVIPFSIKSKDCDQISQIISQKLFEIDNRYNAKIQIDRDYQ